MEYEQRTQDLGISLNGGVHDISTPDPPAENHRPKTDSDNECRVETLLSTCEITPVSELLIQHDSPHSVLSYDEGIRAAS